MQVWESAEVKATRRMTWESCADCGDIRITKISSDFVSLLAAVALPLQNRCFVLPALMGPGVQ